MDIIERTKHDGAVVALKGRINTLASELKGRNWNDIQSGSTYIRLGDAITDAETILRQMRETLEALQAMEPDNK